MRLKRWFYRGGTQDRVARIPDRDTAALYAKQARVWEVGTVTGMRLFRIGGLLVFLGAVAFVLHVVLRSVLTAGVDPAVSAQAGLWVPLNALGALVHFQNRCRVRRYSGNHETSHIRPFTFGHRKRALGKRPTLQGRFRHAPSPDHPRQQQG